MNGDLYEQVRAELDSWRARGLRREIAGPRGVDFTSNDYLALSRDSRVLRAAEEALRSHGASATASRLLRGHTDLHERAERAAASLYGTAAALLFPSGWQANQAVLTSLASTGDVLFSDALNHASIVEGCRLSRARLCRFAHLDAEDLEQQLARTPGARRRLVVTESTYSMDGDGPPLEHYLELCERYDAYLLVDDAHNLQLFLEPPIAHPRIATRMITGGKALGSSGAFVAGSPEVIDLLVQRSRSFIYTTAPAPSTAAALLSAITVARAEPERARRALDLAERLRQRLREAGLEISGDAAVVPVMVGAGDRAMEVARRIQDQGFDVRAVRPPTVPDGTSRLRLVCHADHTDAQVEAVADAVIHSLEGTVTTTTRPPVNSPQAIVVTGTDTGIGKTVVAALLVRAFAREGEDLAYLKPVQTGAESDTEVVLRLAGLKPSEAAKPLVELPLPASVDQAAKDAGVEVSAAQLVDGSRHRLRERPGSRWILECAGGLRVPVNDREDQSDFLSRLSLPVVLVARTGLGTLNHTLLSVEALQKRGIKLAALFLVGERHAANVETLRTWLPSVPLFEVPRFDVLNTEALDRWLTQNEDAARQIDGNARMSGSR